MKLRDYSLIGLIGVSCMAMILVPPWMAIAQDDTSSRVLGFLGYAPLFAPPPCLYKGEVYLPAIDWLRLTIEMISVTTIELLAWKFAARSGLKNRSESSTTESALLQKQRLPRSWVTNQ